MPGLTQMSLTVYAVMHLVQTHFHIHHSLKVCFEFSFDIKLLVVEQNIFVCHRLYKQTVVSRVYTVIRQGS